MATQEVGLTMSGATNASPSDRSLGNSAPELPVSINRLQESMRKTEFLRRELADLSLHRTSAQPVSADWPHSPRVLLDGLKVKTDLISQTLQALLAEARGTPASGFLRFYSPPQHSNEPLDGKAAAAASMTGGSEAGKTSAAAAHGPAPDGSGAFAAFAQSWLHDLGSGLPMGETDPLADLAALHAPLCPTPREVFIASSTREEAPWRSNGTASLPSSEEETLEDSPEMSPPAAKRPKLTDSPSIPQPNLAGGKAEDSLDAMAVESAEVIETTRPASAEPSPAPAVPSLAEFLCLSSEDIQRADGEDVGGAPLIARPYSTPFAPNRAVQHRPHQHNNLAYLSKPPKALAKSGGRRYSPERSHGPLGYGHHSASPAHPTGHAASARDWNSPSRHSLSSSHLSGRSHERSPSRHSSSSSVPSSGTTHDHSSAHSTENSASEVSASSSKSKAGPSSKFKGHKRTEGRPLARKNSKSRGSKSASSSSNSSPRSSPSPSRGRKRSRDGQDRTEEFYNVPSAKTLRKEILADRVLPNHDRRRLFLNLAHHVPETEMFDYFISAGAKLLYIVRPTGLGQHSFILQFCSQLAAMEGLKVVREAGELCGVRVIKIDFEVLTSPKTPLTDFCELYRATTYTDFLQLESDEAVVEHLMKDFGLRSVRLVSGQKFILRFESVRDAVLAIKHFDGAFLGDEMIRLVQYSTAAHTRPKSDRQ